MRNKWFSLVLVLLLALITACNNNGYVPKPRGYLRIDLPQKNWVRYDSLINYSFEYPVYAEVLRDPLGNNQDEWVNINYPQQKASLHLSYKKVNNNLNAYVEDARTMALKHLPKANSISDSLFYLQHNNVAGAFYLIGGKGVASPIQFYATDSNRHFVRGALYFNFRPNNDSIEPVIRFIKEDISHFLNSISWANS